MYKKIMITTTLFITYTTSFCESPLECSLTNYKDFSSCNRDLVISNNFNLSGIMFFSGKGVDFLDINGITQNATIGSAKNIYIVRNSGAAATLNLTLPAAAELNNGQILYISANDANLTLNIIAGAGTTLSSSVTVNPSLQGVMLTYRQIDSSWYQLT